MLINFLLYRQIANKRAKHIVEIIIDMVVLFEVLTKQKTIIFTKLITIYSMLSLVTPQTLIYNLLFSNVTREVPFLQIQIIHLLMYA